MHIGVANGGYRCYNPWVMTHEAFSISQVSGVIAPVETPFDYVEGAVQVDVQSQDTQLRRLVDLGVHSIFLGSNAGEGRQMSPEDWKTSISEGIKSVNGAEKDRHVPIFVGVLRTDIDEVIHLAKFAEEQGADALVFAPKYTKGQMWDNLHKLIAETNLPIILYNNPEFQNQESMPMIYVEKASQLDRVVGIKDTSRDTEYFGELLKLRDAQTFHVVQGDTKTGHLNEQLADIDGLVPVEANVYPDILLSAWGAGDTSKMTEMIQFFETNKKKYKKGTLELIKVILSETPNHIFKNPMMYPVSEAK